MTIFKWAIIIFAILLLICLCGCTTYRNHEGSDELRPNYPSPKELRGVNTM